MCAVCAVTFIAFFIVNRKKIANKFEEALKQDTISEQEKEKLMPMDAVYTYLEKNHYRDASPRKRVKLLRTLCRIYNVDEIVALKRTREVYAVKNKWKS